MPKLRPMLPYLSITAIGLYLLPLVMMGNGMGLMLFVLPAVVLGCAFAYGIRNRFHWTCIFYPIAVSALFAPTILIYYNATALVYVIVFGAIALAGCLVGRLFSVKAP